jgi:hypothetical protein
MTGIDKEVKQQLYVRAKSEAASKDNLRQKRGYRGGWRGHERSEREGDLVPGLARTCPRTPPAAGEAAPAPPPQTN